MGAYFVGKGIEHLLKWGGEGAGVKTSFVGISHHGSSGIIAAHDDESTVVRTVENIIGTAGLCIAEAQHCRMWAGVAYP